MLHRKISTWVAAVGFGLLSASASAQSLTLTLDSVVPWVYYAGHAGSRDFVAAAGLLNFSVTGHSGPSFNFPLQLSLYCVELQQNIAIHSTGNVYTIVSADQASSGVNTGLSANIPLAGIGASRVQNLEVLYAHVFGAHYDPVALNDTEKSAFQLAAWELSHDDDFNLTGGSGLHYWITSRGPAVTEAQTLVDWVAANFSTAPEMHLYALHNSATQDFLIPDGSSLTEVPEPASSALAAGLAALGAMIVSRRKWLGPSGLGAKTGDLSQAR